MLVFSARLRRRGVLLRGVLHFPGWNWRKGYQWLGRLEAPYSCVALGFEECPPPSLCPFVEGQAAVFSASSLSNGPRVLTTNWTLLSRRDRASA